MIEADTRPKQSRARPSEGAARGRAGASETGDDTGAASERARAIAYLDLWERHVARTASRCGGVVGPRFRR